MSQLSATAVTVNDTHWHLVLHGRPAHAGAGPAMQLHGRPLATLDLLGQAASEPLPVSFEGAFAALERLPLFIEGDGSFCWTAPGAAWRIFGELYDGGPRLMYVEVKGWCPEPEFRELLLAFGGQATPLMVQLVREGVFTEATEFLTWAY